MTGESRRNCWSILAILLLHHLLTYSESVNVTDQRIKHVPFLTNLKASVKCACRHPQPRFIHIDDLEEYRIPNAIFLPAALLIHRCDRSVGYCHAPAHECASVESEEQVVTFHVKNLFTPSKPRLTSVTLRNHTRCRCVSIRSRTAGPSTGLPSSSLNDIPDE
ncbi:uncharacterized protein LOC124197120 [Daphnia pulex]|uniref:uncharacterized protein LOC124197120 n=1 Tax=Daphnia pulex TaxID=6669 RepID=UPI001EDE4658|nr:uncharacterized protein LOC124197120 [Daphnia pulex]